MLVVLCVSLKELSKNRQRKEEAEDPEYYLLVELPDPLYYKMEGTI